MARHSRTQDKPSVATDSAGTATAPKGVIESGYCDDGARPTGYHTRPTTTATGTSRVY